jgi:Tol biopolymer transport system component
MPHEPESPAPRQRASWRARAAMATAVVVTAIGAVGVLWPDEPVRELRAGGQLEVPGPDEGPTVREAGGEPVPSTGTSGTSPTGGPAQPVTATAPRSGPRPQPASPGGPPSTGPGKTTSTVTGPTGERPTTSSTAPPTTVTTAAPAGGTAVRSPRFTDLLAFVDSDRNGPDHFLAVVDVRRGGDPRRLTRMDGTMFSWAPDGARIAFLQDGSIHVLDTGTGAVHALSGSRGVEDQPVWSPDGSWIAYRDGSDNEDSGLWIMHADGSERHRISGRTSGAPAWSPDGALIAFGALSGPSAELHVLTVDGTALRNLTAGEGGGSSPVFSPDGRRLAFIADDDTLAVAEVASSEIRRLPAVGKIANPSWAPDGRSILVQHVEGQQTSIRIVDPADGSARRVSPADPGPEGQAAGYRWKAYTRPLWTADGTAIVYEGDCRGNGGDLCRLDTATGNVTLLVDGASGPFGFQPRP